MKKKIKNKKVLQNQLIFNFTQNIKQGEVF